MLVLNLLAFESKKYTAYDHVHGNGPYHWQNPNQERTNMNARVYLKTTLPYNNYTYSTLSTAATLFLWNRHNGTFIWPALICWKSSVKKERNLLWLQSNQSLQTLNQAVQIPLARLWVRAIYLLEQSWSGCMVFPQVNGLANLANGSHLSIQHALSLGSQCVFGRLILSHLKLSNVGSQFSTFHYEHGGNLNTG